MHYCLSERAEPFWRDNRLPAGIPDELQCLLSAWRHRPPSPFRFRGGPRDVSVLQLSVRAVRMGFRTNLEAARSRYTASASASAQQAFKQLRHIGQQAVADLPDAPGAHRADLS